MTTRADTDIQNREETGVTGTVNGSPVVRVKGSKLSAQRVGRLIREARIARHMSQEALSADMHMSKNVVANWERGYCRPDFDLIPYLCELLGISIYDFMGMEEPVKNCDPFLPQDERNLLEDYRVLDTHHRRLVSDMLHTYAVSYTADYIESLKNGTTGLYETEVAYAAGMGEGDVMDGENKMQLGFYRTGRIPHNASFVASVTGTSMEPTFYSGDRVFVEKTQAIDVGDIGLFILNGEALIKEYHRDGLYSHNKKAKPKKFHDGDSVYTISKVIRKVTPEDCFSAEELKDIWKLYREGAICVKASV